MEHFRASDGADIAFTQTGSGRPALLFVHGWQADHSVWRGTIAALGPDVRAVAVDLRGSSESRSARGPYRLERFAADLRELVEHLGLGPVVIVGHSMGGTVALRFAVDAPHATAAIVLIAPVPASGGGYSEKGVQYLRATAGDPINVRSWLARTLGNPSGGALERLCAVAAQTERAVSLESFESWGFADFAAETRGITAPALVIAPQHDLPDAVERKVAALLPNAEFAVLPNAAHYAIVEQPAEIATVIREFVTVRLRRG
jgi:pimeloyl-ACP methyl ester carboxylesterase